MRTYGACPWPKQQQRHAKSTSAGGEKMGETEFWDEFIAPGDDQGSGRIMASY